MFCFDSHDFFANFSLSVSSTIGFAFLIFTLGRYLSPWILAGISGFFYLLSQFSLPFLTTIFPENQIVFYYCSEPFYSLPLDLISLLLLGRTSWSFTEFWEALPKGWSSPSSFSHPDVGILPPNLEWSRLLAVRNKNTPFRFKYLFKTIPYNDRGSFRTIQTPWLTSYFRWIYANGFALPVLIPVFRSFLAKDSLKMLRYYLSVSILYYRFQFFMTTTNNLLRFRWGFYPL